MTNPAPTLALRSAARGFTLTELAIVLGVIGIILGVIWAAAGAVYENNRTARASAQVMQIINGFRSIYGGKRITLGDDVDITAIAINNQFMPADMILSGVTTYGLGPWSGSVVTVKSEQTWNGVSIWFDSLSQSACNHVANAVASSNPGLIGANINGTFRLYPPFGAAANFTTTDINGLCNTTSTNHVGFAYSLN